jgi:ribosomal protein S18 acetylase RimI-like enzyme
LKIELIFEKFDKNIHDRNSFDCGLEVLNSFFKKRANQEQKKNLSVTYVAASASTPDKKSIYGFYTLTNSSISFDKLPYQLVKGIPATYSIPTIRVCRLARAIAQPGLGAELLKDALLRIIDLSKAAGIRGIEVDAKHEQAKNFYRKFGFIELPDQGDSLFLPIDTLKKAHYNRGN